MPKPSHTPTLTHFNSHIPQFSYTPLLSHTPQFSYPLTLTNLNSRTPQLYTHSNSHKSQLSHTPTSHTTQPHTHPNSHIQTPTLTYPNSHTPQLSHTKALTHTPTLTHPNSHTHPNSPTPPTLTHPNLRTPQISHIPTLTHPNSHSLQLSDPLIRGPVVSGDSIEQPPAYIHELQPLLASGHNSCNPSISIPVPNPLYTRLYTLKTKCLLLLPCGQGQLQVSRTQSSVLPLDIGSGKKSQ